LASSIACDYLQSIWYNANNSFAENMVDFYANGIRFDGKERDFVYKWFAECENIPITFPAVMFKPDVKVIFGGQGGKVKKCVLADKFETDLKSISSKYKECQSMEN
jgi:hypothetical protein